jgi:hypothetical protein
VGPVPRWNTANADLYQIYNGGAPLQVTVLNTPLQTGEYLDANSGSTRRTRGAQPFTINLGLRYDYVKQHVIGEPAQTGRFENSVAYDDIYLPTGRAGRRGRRWSTTVRQRQDRDRVRLQPVRDRGRPPASRRSTTRRR